MIPVYEGGAARAICHDEDIDREIAIQQEMLRLRESRPSMESRFVSQAAKDAWQEREWQNRQAVRHYRLRDQDVLSEDRHGRALYPKIFVRTLNTLYGRRFSLNGWALRGYRGLSVSQSGFPLKYICAVQDGIMPEYDKIALDDHGLIKRVIRRGWRTVLLNLIDQKAISESECLQLFGFPWGEHGRIFRRTLWERRNHRMADGELNREIFRTQERASFTH